MSRFPNDMERHAQDGTRAMQLENIEIDKLFKAHMDEAFDERPDENRDAKSYTINDMRHAFGRGWHASKNRLTSTRKVSNG